MVEVRISELAVEKLKNGKKVKFAAEIPMLPEFKNKLRPEDEIVDILGKNPIKDGKTIICLGEYSYTSGGYTHKTFTDCYVETTYNGQRILVPVNYEGEELLFEKFGKKVVEELEKEVMYKALERGI